MILQIIGTPTSGKSTFIKQFIQNNQGWVWLDIATWNNDNWLVAETTLLNSIEESKNTIVESVSGFCQLESKNVLFICSTNDLQLRHKERNIELDNQWFDYYSSLSYQAIKPDVIIDTSLNTSYEQILRLIWPIIYNEK